MPQLETARALPVHDVMATDPLHCAPDENLSSAAQRMWEGDCGLLPVVVDGRVVSVVTDRDVCMAAYSRNRPLSELRVEEAMSQRLITCSAETDAWIVLQAMREHQIRRIPVVDAHGALVGIVTLTDLANEALRIDSHVPKGDVVETLASIVENRWGKA